MIASAQGQQQPSPQQPIAPVYQPQPNAPPLGGQAQPAQVQQLLSMLVRLFVLMSGG
jgi:hypothetical protein